MISIAEIIDPIEQLFKDTPNEGKRVDLNTPLCDMGLSLQDVIHLVEGVKIGTRSNFNLKETGCTYEDISKMHIMQFWTFCQQHMKPKDQLAPNSPKKLKKKRWWRM